MNWFKIVLAAIAITIISQVFHTVESFFTMNYYTDPAYFAVWSKVMMPTAGPPPTSFYIYSIVFNFITGVIFAAMYSMFKGNIPGKTEMTKGLYYGLIWFLITLPSFSTMYLLINLPTMLLVVWAIVGLIISVVEGLVVVKLIK